MAESYNPITGHLQWGYSCERCGGVVNDYGMPCYDMKTRTKNCPDRRSEFKYKYDGTLLEKKADDNA